MILVFLVITYFGPTVKGAAVKDHVSCDRDYAKVGCFKEFHNATAHNLLITDKDDQSDAYQGFELDWDKMKESIHSIACRCSQKSQEEGYDFFYIIHWAECWSSKTLGVILDIDKASQRSSKCFNANFLECDDKHVEECVGGSEEKTNAVYLYKILKGHNSSEPAIDGGLSNWSEYSECSASCGDGIKERERTCTNPIPSGAGKGCVGELSEAVKCNLGKCPAIIEIQSYKVLEPSETLILKEEFPLVKGKLIATLKIMNKEYSISFEVKPTSFEKGWKSVIHLTLGNNFVTYGDRNPGIWFHENGLGGLHICSAVSSYRNLCKDTNPIQIDKWSTIKVTQQFSEGSYVYSIYINGENIFSTINTDPRNFENVKVFMADPWHNAQNGFVRNLRIINGNEGKLLVQETQLIRGNLLAVLPKLDLQYIVSFDIKPNSFSKDWRNVLHFTIGSDVTNYGDRVPGVWFHNNGDGSLCIAAPINGNLNRFFITKPVLEKEWSHVEVSQQLENGAYMYTISLNGEKVFSEQNTVPQYFENVEVYTSDPWYPAQDGLIKNLILVNGKKDEPTPIAAIVRPKESVDQPIQQELKKSKLTVTLSRLEKEYTVSFKIKPVSYSQGWKSVIHLTKGQNIGRYGDRTPAAWFHHDGSGKLTIASAINGNSNYYFNTQPLPLNEWSSFQISQYRVNGVYTFVVYLNGHTIHSVENSKPESFENIKVYLGDPWYDTQPGFIKDLSIINGNVEKLLKDKETHLVQRNLVANIPKFGKIYRVSFDVKPNSFSKGWHNVIHFTVGSDADKYGDRVPGVWFHNNGDGSLHIAAPINGDINRYFDTTPLPLNDWSHIEISQQLENNIYIYKIQLNGENVFSEVNSQPKSFDNVKVYASDPWYLAQDGLIKNLVIINRQPDEEFLQNAVVVGADVVEDATEHTIVKDNLIAELPSLEKTYSVSFKIKPTLYSQGWKSVIHLTIGQNIGRYGDRTPAVWFLHDGSGRLTIASAINDNANYYFHTEPLQLNKWSSVQISQVRIKEVHTFIVYIDGKVIHSVENTKPQSFKNVKVYTADPWYDTQDGSLKDLRIINGNVEKLIEDRETPLVQRNQVAVIPKLEKSFRVYFDVKPKSFSKGWHNVIHFTIDSDVNKYGDRVPGVWFHNSGDGSLYIAAPINGNLDRVFKTEPLLLNEWSHVEISQQLENNIYLYTIKLNGEIIFSEENSQPKSFDNVKVYASNPWYAAQDGFIKDLSIVNGKPDDELLPNVLLITKDYLEMLTEEILKKNNLVATLPYLEKTYSVSFELMPRSYSQGWKSVIHLTIGQNIGQYGERTPAVWFLHDGSGRLAIASAISGNQNYYFLTDPLNLNEWSNLRILQYRNNGVYIFSVYINGKLIHSIENTKPQSFKNVKVYTADPWYDAQDGSIKDLRIVNGNIEQLIENKETRLVQSNLVAVIPKLEKSYKIYFDVKPNSFSEGWHNVIHFTIGSDVNKYGDRVPGVWFHNSGDGSLYIAAPINGNLDRVFKTEPLPLKKWSHVEISQQSENNIYVYTIKLNGENIFSEENTQPKSFDNVKVFASDPWYRVHDGSIKDLAIINGKPDEESLSNVVLVTKDLDLATEEMLKKNNLIATLPLLDKAYSVSFNLKPNSYSVGWKSVIHLTIGQNIGQYGERTPAVWFLHDGSGKLTIASAINGNPNYYFHTDPLPLNQWSNIRISQFRFNGVYTFTVYINGKVIHSIENTKPQSFKNVKVYTADPWYDEQDGFIKDLRIINGNIEQLIEDKETPLVQNNLVAIVPRLEKIFKVFFEVKPNSFSEGWHNVIHFTIGSDVSKYGDRVPGIWFHNSGDGSLYIAAPINGILDRVFKTEPLPPKEWSHIEISQQFVSDVYLFSVSLNGINVFSEQNNQPETFENVKVFASDPWYSVQDGSIKNLFIVNGELDANVSDTQVISKYSGSKWNLLKKGACFEGKNDQPAEVPINRNGAIVEVKLVHQTGRVKCADFFIGSNFGCFNDQTLFSVFICNKNKKVLFPSSRKPLTFPDNRNYIYPGYLPTDKEVILTNYDDPSYFNKGDSIYIWNNEDLYNAGEGDNVGRACVDVYVSFAD
nr:uncharacterized protein LOC100212432 [Hydra vulgaris]